MRNHKLDLPILSYKALTNLPLPVFWFDKDGDFFDVNAIACKAWGYTCLLYTSPSPRDATLSRMPSSA